MENKKYLIFTVLIFTFVCVFYAMAWTGPSATPPDDNAPAPINVSDSSQQKDGAFSLKKYLRLIPAQSGNITETDDGIVFYDVSNNAFKCRENGNWLNCVGGFFQKMGANLISLLDFGNGRVRITNVATPAGDVDSDVATVGYVKAQMGGDGASAGAGTKNLWNIPYTKLGSVTFQANQPLAYVPVGDLPNPSNDIILCSESGAVSTCAPLVYYYGNDEGQFPITTSPIIGNANTSPFSPMLSFYYISAACSNGAALSSGSCVQGSRARIDIVEPNSTAPINIPYASNNYIHLIYQTHNVTNVNPSATIARLVGRNFQVGRCVMSNGCSGSLLVNFPVTITVWYR